MTPAADVCPKCGRSTTDYGDDSCWASRKPRNATVRRECRIVAAGFRRGLREGVELAREHVTPTRDESGLIDETGRIDFTAVDAELTRRLSDG